MKTKTKTRLALSICALTLIFSACKKDSATPDLDTVLDCMLVENGVSAMDDCGDCHQSYIYDYVSHVPTYIEDTVELVLGVTEMLVLAGSDEDIAQNPNWNSSCTDCNDVRNGVAAMDDCGDCHQSYIYDYVSHVPTYIEDTVELVLGATEMLVLAGSDEDIAQNPNWNASCTDCSGILNGTAIIDDCEDCHKWLVYNFTTHVTREVNDTINEVLLANEMFSSPNNPMNPLWNTGCK